VKRHDFIKSIVRAELSDREQIRKVCINQISDNTPVNVPQERQRKSWGNMTKWLVPITTCLAVVIAIPILASHWNVSSPEIAKVVPWNEKTITQKFNLLTFNGFEYTVSIVSYGAEYTTLEVDYSKVGMFLGNAMLRGYDVGDGDKEYMESCEVFAIKSVSKECAVAVKYEGHSGYYPFVNHYYFPQTLGNLIDDLNLRENLVFTTIHNEYFENGVFTMATYSIDADSIIWEMLLSDTSLPNQAENNQYNPMWFVSLMSVGVDIEVIGCRNVSIAVSENGYLQTNILGTAKSFFIGKDKVQAFVNYVLGNGSKSIISNGPDKGGFYEE